MRDLVMLFVHLIATVVTPKDSLIDVSLSADVAGTTGRTLKESVCVMQCLDNLLRRKDG